MRNTDDGSPGQRLKRLRSRKGWSMRQLAERAGIDSSTVLRIERGDTPNPGAETLRKLAHALGEPLETLTGTKLPPDIPTTGRIRRTEDVDLPVYRAHAGRLDLAPEGAVDIYSVRTSQSYVVEVTGTCMEYLGIHEGDRLLIDRALRPEAGDVVVVRIGEDVFLAEWVGRRTGGSIQLRLTDEQLIETLYSEVTLLGTSYDQLQSTRHRGRRLRETVEDSEDA